MVVKQGLAPKIKVRYTKTTGHFSITSKMERKWVELSEIIDQFPEIRGKSRERLIWTLIDYINRLDIGQLLILTEPSQVSGGFEQVENEYDRFVFWLKEKKLYGKTEYYNCRKGKKRVEEVSLIDYNYLTRSKKEMNAIEFFHETLHNEWCDKLGNNIYQDYLRGKRGVAPRLMTGIETYFKKDKNKIASLIPPKKARTDLSVSRLKPEDIIRSPRDVAKLASTIQQRHKASTIK